MYFGHLKFHNYGMSRGFQALSRKFKAVSREFGRFGAISATFVAIPTEVPEPPYRSANSPNMRCCEVM